MNARLVLPVVLPVALPVVLATVSLTLAAGSSRAAEPAAAPARTVEAILKDYAAAIGGEGAFRKHRTIELQRALTVEGLGVGGTEKRWATADGKLLSVTELAGVGTVKAGSTGKVFWSEDPINGLRILEGAEAEQARIDATWMSELRLRELYQTVNVVPAPEGAAAQEKLECLELVPELGRPTIACFSAESHLRVFQSGKQQGPQGEIPYRAEFSDWRTVGGIKIPFRERMVAGPMTIVAEIQEVTFDKKIPPKTFVMPKPTAVTGDSPASGKRPGKAAGKSGGKAGGKTAGESGGKTAGAAAN